MLVLTPLEQFNIESIIIPVLPYALTNMAIYLYFVLILTLTLTMGAGYMSTTNSTSPALPTSPASTSISAASGTSALPTSISAASLPALPTSISLTRNFGIIETIIDSISNIGAAKGAGLRSEFFQIKLISLLIFILSANLIGVIPYSFTVTTHFSITLSFSIAIIASFTIISIIRNGILFLNSFIPSGTPLVLAPLLLIIETISYTARSISLGTRLAANLLAGHTLLHIISGFIVKLIYFVGTVNALVLLLMPLLLLLALFIMELIIAVLQGYVFLLLTINYLSNALHLH